MGYRKLPEDAEQRMLNMRALGMDNREIAAQIPCSVMTVYNKIGGSKKYKAREEVAKAEIAEQAVEA
jgi:DNA-binding CsgD family transcriptional regulator